MKNRFNRSRTCVFNINYHLIWCPKYRRRILIGSIEKRLKSLILEKAKELNVSIEEMEVMPDHIHIFVSSKPIHAPSHLVKHFKGFTSKKLREEFPHLQRHMPTLWTRSYYCESVGHISAETIRKYVRNQKLR